MLASQPDLGHASPVWMVVLLGILVAPFIWGIVYGLRHRDSGAPSKEDLLDADTSIELERFRARTRPPSFPGFRGP